MVKNIKSLTPKELKQVKAIIKLFEILGVDDNGFNKIVLLSKLDEKVIEDLSKYQILEKSIAKLIESNAKIMAYINNSTISEKTSSVINDFNTPTERLNTNVK